MFEYSHLPPSLQPIVSLADSYRRSMLAHLQDGPELSAGLRKLREATDCFVRQAVIDLKAAGTAIPANTPKSALLFRDETPGRANDSKA